MGSKVPISLSIIYFLESYSKTSINLIFKICPGIWLKCSSNLFFRYPQSHEVDNWDGNHIWCSTELCAAGYSEEEIFLDSKNLSFGLMALKMALTVHNEHNEQWIFELCQNIWILDVLTKLDFLPFGLENGPGGQFWPQGWVIWSLIPVVTWFLLLRGLI